MWPLSAQHCLASERAWPLPASEGLPASRVVGVRCTRPRIRQLPLREPRLCAARIPAPLDPLGRSLAVYSAIGFARYGRAWALCTVSASECRVGHRQVCRPDISAVPVQPLLVRLALCHGRQESVGRLPAHVFWIIGSRSTMDVSEHDAGSLALEA